MFFLSRAELAMEGALPPPPVEPPHAAVAIASAPTPSSSRRFRTPRRRPSRLSSGFAIA
jgi:hypothetical protein